MYQSCTGTKAITVTVSNMAATASETYVVDVVSEPEDERIYLPVVLRGF